VIVYEWRYDLIYSYVDIVVVTTVQENNREIWLQPDPRVLTSHINRHRLPPTLGIRHPALRQAAMPPTKSPGPHRHLLAGHAGRWRSPCSGHGTVRIPTLRFPIALTLLLVVVFGSTLPPATAQQPAKIPRIGLIRPGSPPDPFAEAFLQGLRDLG